MAKATRAWFWVFKGFASDEGRTMIVGAEGQPRAPILGGQWELVGRQLLDVDAKGYPAR